MKFKIFTVTKNEYDLIEDFINYYGSIFGYENLVIIDNGSDNQIVLDIYEKYKLKGINVYFEIGYQGNLQADHFNKYMNKYKNDCDWLIGLDTDEFMIVSNKDNFSSNNLFNELSNTLEKLDPTIDKITVNYFNSHCPKEIIKYKRPAKEIIRFSKKKNSTKFFYRSKNFIYTNIGNHNGRTLNEKEILLENIAYAHYHSTGYKRMIERAHQICCAYDYISKNDDEFNILKKINLSTMIFGIHRVEQIYNFYVKKVVLDLFIKYIKRLPEENELKRHVENFNLSEIETQFENCIEAKNNLNKSFFLTDEELEKIYYTQSCEDSYFLLDDMSTKITCISEYLEEIK